ncbi:hypothetical protein KC347_g157 [Hortaea werneckii]|nr:hypothetical protein KC347_g157 [Hortaea werneckii]
MAFSTPLAGAETRPHGFDWAEWQSDGGLLATCPFFCYMRGSWAASEGMGRSRLVVECQSYCTWLQHVVRSFFLADIDIAITFRWIHLRRYLASEPQSRSPPLKPAARDTSLRQTPINREHSLAATPAATVPLEQPHITGLRVHGQEIARLQAEAERFDATNGTSDAFDSMTGMEEAAEEGEINENAPETTKIYLQGVDRFQPMDVKAYATEHYSTDFLNKKLEWVNDSAVKLVYDTEVAAEEALQAFSAEEQTDPLILRRAKPLNTIPDVELFVRQAVTSDVKAKNARLHSRFYLDNPDFDPELRQRRWEENQRKYRERGWAQQSKRKRDVGDELYSRRRSRDGSESFDVDLYDDKPQAQAKRSEQPESQRGDGELGRKRRRNQGGDLLEGRDKRRLRDRSASPMRDGDGRFGFAEEQPRRPTPRARSPTPPRARSSRDNHSARDNMRKELFADRSTAASGAALTQGNGHGPNTDSFPEYSSPSRSRELFPNHKRQAAHDLDMDYSNRQVNQVTERMGRYSLGNNAFSGTVNYYNPAQYTYDFRSTDNQRSRSNNDRHRQERKPRDLFERIGNGKPMGESNYGRLQAGPSMSSSQPEDDGPGFSFKGAGKNADSGGFVFKGASSKEKTENPLVKELFPLNNRSGAGGGSGGKDLFDGRIKGRGSQRRRAEDLDYGLSFGQGESMPGCKQIGQSSADFLVAYILMFKFLTLTLNPLLQYPQHPRPSTAAIVSSMHYAYIKDLGVRGSTPDSRIQQYDEVL